MLKSLSTSNIVINITFLVLVVGLVFCYLPSNYEQTKVILFLLVSTFLGIYVVFNSQLLLNSLKGANKWLLLWVGILLFSSLQGVHPETSILGGSYRHQGVLFFIAIFILSVFSHIKIIKVLMATAAIQAVVVILQYIFNENLLNGRPIGTIGEPNAVAGFLALTSITAYVTIKNYTNKFIFLTLILLALLFSQSITAISCFLLIHLILLIHKTKIVYKNYLIIILCLVAFFVAGYFALFIHESIYEDRRIIWQFAFQAILARPFLGYGAESGEVVYDLAYSQAEMPLLSLMIDRSHNLFLDVTLWSGTLGLVVFCIWIYKLSFTKKSSWYTKSFIAGFLLFAFLQPLGVVHWTVFIFLAKGLPNIV